MNMAFGMVATAVCRRLAPLSRAIAEQACCTRGPQYLPANEVTLESSQAAPAADGRRVIDGGCWNDGRRRNYRFLRAFPRERLWITRVNIVCLNKIFDSVAFFE